MKTRLTFLLFAALAALSRPFRPRTMRLANIAEGQHLASQGISMISDVAITERFLVVKKGSAAGKVDICTAADIPFGVCSDEIAAADIATIPVNVQTFNSDMTLKMVASAAIAYGDQVEPANAGRVATLVLGAGTTSYIIGTALQAAGAAGDVIEVAPCFSRVVTP
jgi:hypothetical protein